MIYLSFGHVPSRQLVLSSCVTHYSSSAHCTFMIQKWSVHCATMRALKEYTTHAPRDPAHLMCTHYKTSTLVSAIIVYNVNGLNCAPTL